MPAQSDWADISSQMNREAEYKGTLLDLLRSVQDLLEESFVLLEDEVELDEDEAAAVWAALDNLVAETGFTIKLLHTD